MQQSLIFFDSEIKTLKLPLETVKPYEDVKPVHVIACNDVVPDETVKPDKDVKPVHTMLFVESKPIEYFPKFGPIVVTNENRTGELAI